MVYSSTARGTHRRGFTLVEMLIVITVIALLAGLLIPSLSMVRNREKAYRTLVMMDNLKIAVTAYLGEYATLGDPERDNDPGDYTTWSGNLYDPMFYMYRNLPSNKRNLELLNQHCVRDISGNGAGPFIAVGDDEVTHVADGWKDGILFQVREEPMPGLATRFRATEVYMRSLSGGADFEDQVLERFDVIEGTWQQVKLVDIDTNGRWITKDL